MVAGWGGDTYISKLDISGNFVWAKQMVGSAYAGGSSITVDASGNIYTTGTYIGGVDFDPGPGIYNLSSGGSTAFISKLDVSGNFLWAKHFIEQTGFSSNSGGNSIALDVSNNIYITGTFQDTVDFDPGTGVNNLISTGMTSIYVSKLDASGNFIWAQRMGGYQLGAGGEGDQGNSIAVYGPDYIYTTGNFQSTSDFDPSAGVYNLTSAGAEDIFIAKLCQNTPPQPTITASGATTFCQGDNVILTSSAANNNLWSNGATTQSITVNTSGNYSVSVSNTNGCSATSISESITVLPVPQFTYSTSGMVASFSIFGTGCTSFLWDFGNGNTSTINPNPIVTYATPGTYTPCLQCTGNTCVSCLTITVPSTSSGGVGIIETPFSNYVTISPNPFTSQTTITFSDASTSSATYIIKIMDVAGREIQNAALKMQNGRSVTIDMSGYAKGVYFVQITDGSAGSPTGVVNRKIVLQ